MFQFFGLLLLSLALPINAFPSMTFDRRLIADFRETFFDFEGEIKCDLAKKGHPYVALIKLWEDDSYLSDKLGDDELKQVYELDRDAFPNTYTIFAREQGDGWDPGMEYELYLSVQHNCTPNRQTIVTDIPITSQKFEIKNKTYHVTQNIDLTPGSADRRSAEKRLRRRRRDVNKRRH
ncbi:hypothetical protein GCK72_001079 [Caenorhabditis remanei]|uniref:Uncharacterized protein n=1 Tax=Caenorhabditis remanei TaxID=31234 RepID=A0A6A5HSS0_CAERE|nr:hypothetical protein GCK72_001079 [Caenorhabditis remanei]KAF1769263.1 hypothetical protein GCK72_001079 [Caenorhabditis remanei]